MASERITGDRQNGTEKVIVVGRFSILAWIAAEILTYMLVIREFGIAWAMLIGIISLALGFFAFGRLGVSFTSTVWNSNRDPERVWSALKKSGLAALGAALLILPGFLSNLAGVLLLAANAKAWLSGSSSAPTARDGVIDLERDEWRDRREATQASDSLSNHNKRRDFDL